MRAKVGTPDEVLLLWGAETRTILFYNNNEKRKGLAARCISCIANSPGGMCQQYVLSARSRNLLTAFSFASRACHSWLGIL